MSEQSYSGPNFTEAVIVGGGPIGIETAIALQDAGVGYRLFEAGQIGSAISRWPPQTHFFSTPEHVAIAGFPVQNVDQQPITGEQYLAYLRSLVEYFDLNLHSYEPVRSIERENHEFVLTTERHALTRRYRCRFLIMATGGMARPRLLNIPGEDLPHVSHYFPGPHAYFRQRLLVVGGKNSALESALRSWRAGAQVSISYRRENFDFDVVKPHLADDIKARISKGEIAFLPCSVPVRIAPDHVVLAETDGLNAVGGKTFMYPTDFVLLATGFVADMELFKGIGVELRGPELAPVFDEETMETNVPRVFVAGTAAGGTQVKFAHFISTSHDHVAKIVQAISGQAATRLGTIPSRNNAVTLKEVKAN